MPFIPCFLCGSNLEKRIAKTKKPYFVCFACGIQVFVRGKIGIAKLDELLSHFSETNLPFHRVSGSFLQFRGLISEIEDLRAQIKRLDNEITFLFPDNELVRTRDALQKRVNAVLAQLEQSATAKSQSGKGK
jgi:hypothetical protein